MAVVNGEDFHPILHNAVEDTKGRLDNTRMLGRLAAVCALADRAQRRRRPTYMRRSSAWRSWETDCRCRSGYPLGRGGRRW